MRAFAGTRLSTERNPTGEVIEKLRTYSTGAGVSAGLIFPQENRTVGRSKSWGADWESVVSREGHLGCARSWDLVGNGIGGRAKDWAGPRLVDAAASGVLTGDGASV